MIQTNRLQLVPLTLDHAPAVLQHLWRDEQVLAYTNMTPLTTLEACEGKLYFFLQGQTDPTCPNHFAVLRKRRLIGIVGYPPLNSNHSQFGLYYQFAQAQWGKGYGTEATTALLNFIFEHHPRAIVYADVVPENVASVKILQTLGFTQTDVEEGDVPASDNLSFYRGK